MGGRWKRGRPARPPGLQSSGRDASSTRPDGSSVDGAQSHSLPRPGSFLTAEIARKGAINQRESLPFVVNHINLEVAKCVFRSAFAK